MERLTRFREGASREERAEFGRDLLAALDRAGVKPGEEFIVAGGAEVKGDGKLYQVDEPDANAMGPMNADSATSRKAALFNYPRSGTQRHRILRTIVAVGAYGKTRDELSRELGLSQSSTHPRVLELITGEWIEESELVRKTQTGAEAVVLVATEKGRNAVRDRELALS